jgi:hydroxyacylglutathione hydrolase
MKRTVICEGLIYLEPDSMRSFQACAGLLIRDGGTTALVDANMGSSETLPLLAETRPDLAILTHYHVDHSAWASRVAAHTRAEVRAPAAEVDILRATTPLHAAEARANGIGGEWESFLANTVEYASVPHVKGYAYDDSFRIGGIGVTALDARGHSPGHTVFYLPERRILFCADMGIDRFGPWYGWPNCDLVALVGSLMRLRGLPQKLLLTSHGGIVSSGFETVWTHAISQVVAREVRLQMDLDAGRSKEEIVAEGIFFTNKARAPQPMRGFLFMWDRIMYEHHLAVLDQGGLQSFFPELGQMVAAAQAEALGAPTPFKKGAA